MHLLTRLALMTGAVISTAALATQGSYTRGLLDGLQRGAWVVTPRDGGAKRLLCLGNSAQLVQLSHAGQACTRALVEGTADKVTVQYSCKGNGYGRTTIRQETAALVQIDSQGVKGGRPFQISAEARRIGPCR